MSFFEQLVSVTIFGAILARGIIVGRRSVHILQLEGYRTSRFLKWLRTNVRSMYTWQQAVLLVFLAGLAGLDARLNSSAGTSVVADLALVTWLVFEGMWTRADIAIRSKKPLVVTFRVARILSATIVLLVLALTISAAYFFGGGVSVARLHTVRPSAAMVLVCFLALQVTPLFVIAANLILLPIEKALQSSYRSFAKRKVTALNPTIVGITGSFGKTTTKQMIGALLNIHCRTLATPLSYNSLMGVTRTIRENLLPEHEVFVVEMGAYGPGEIAELCELTPPKIGVLTAIGPQHLERFGSLEAIERTKSELLLAVPRDGLAVVNISDAICARVARSVKHCRVCRVSIGPEDADLWAVPESIGYGSEGLSFNVSSGDGVLVHLSTKLLGRHNISNILCAIAVARELGLTAEEMRRAVRRFEPSSHRLELRRLANGIVVIDDSYNSNPVGFRNALEVLGMFGCGRRILVTPGMVELGPREQEENREVGMVAAATCSLVVLVGQRPAIHIRDGLIASGFPESEIVMVDSFADAQKVFMSIAESGDVVLLENDLPDNYFNKRQTTARTRRTAHRDYLKPVVE